MRGNVYGIMEAYLKYKNKHLKTFKKEYEIILNDYRDEDVEDKEKFVNEKVSQLPFHQLIKQGKLDEL